MLQIFVTEEGLVGAHRCYRGSMESVVQVR
jgi:hypothetical protein